MNIYTCIVLLTLLSAPITSRVTKKYSRCFKSKCFADQSRSKQCCRVGGRLAKHSYDCKVDTAIATQRYKARFLQKTSHAASKMSKLLPEIKQCKPYDTCLECCCLYRRRRITNSVKNGR